MKPSDRFGAISARLTHWTAIDRTWRQQLVLVFLVTVLIRLIFAYLIFPSLAPEAGLLSTDGYDRIAHNLAQGLGYVVAPDAPPALTRMPLYPLLLAAVFKCLGTDLRMTQCIQAVLDGFTVVFVFLIARQIFSSRAALFAGWMFALHPLSILYSARFYSESLYTLLLCAFVWTLFLLMQRREMKVAALAGLVLGAMALTRSVTLAVPVALFPWLLLTVRSGDERKKMARAALLMLLGMGLLLSPWVVRNYRLTGKMLLAGTTFGSALYHGYYISQHWSWDKNLARLHDEAAKERWKLISQTLQPTGSVQDYYRANQIVVDAVKEKIWRHPAKVVLAFLRNIPLTWFLTRSKLVTVCMGLLHVPLLLLALITVWRCWRRRGDDWRHIGVFLGMITTFNLVHAFAFPFARYLLPVVPLLMILASAELVRIAERALPRRSARIHYEPIG